MFWVQIRRIPIHFLTRRMIGHIGGLLDDLINVDIEREGVIHVDMLGCV